MGEGGGRTPFWTWKRTWRPTGKKEKTQKNLGEKLETRSESLDKKKLGKKISYYRKGLGPD